MNYVSRGRGDAEASGRWCILGTVIVQTRPATRGDTRFLAWVMQEAGRSHLESGLFEFLLPDAEKRLAFLDAVSNADARSFFHHENFLVAEIDGRQAAALSGYEPAVAAP